MVGRCLTHPKVGKICQRVARVTMREQVARSKPWRNAIEKAAPIYLQERADKHQPIKVTYLFAITRTSAAEGRDYPTTQSAQGVGGDADKFLRLLLDALESCGVLHNDAQVVRFGESGKVYADDPAWLAVGGQRGVPGMWCQIEPVGRVADLLPYELTLDQDERSGR
jgi:Holliday junction resolvase RusA-like endonuclease